MGHAFQDKISKKCANLVRLAWCTFLTEFVLKLSFKVIFFYRTRWYMLMDVSRIFSMIKHETLGNFVRSGICFNGKFCLKIIDFLRK